MKPFYTAYVLLDCPFCKKAIKLLQDKKVPFLTVIMDMNPEFVDRIKEDMKHPTVPIVVQQLENSTIRIIGGADDLEKYLNSQEQNDPV